MKTIQQFLWVGLLGVGGCLIGPSHQTPSWIESEWAIGQCRVAHLNPPPTGNPWRVKASSFMFIPQEQFFDCGGAGLSYGCFTTGGIIRYYVQTPTVIRHEAGHAILYTLGDPRWHCYEHGDPNCSPPEGVCE